MDSFHSDDTFGLVKERVVNRKVRVGCEKGMIPPPKKKTTIIPQESRHTRLAIGLLIKINPLSEKTFTVNRLYSQQALPCTPPPKKTIEGGFIFCTCV